MAAMSLRADQDLRPPTSGRRKPAFPRLRRKPDHPARAGNHHHRYSRFVGIMKVLLPSLAVVLLGLVLVWPKLSLDDDRFRIGFAALTPDAVNTLAMVNARYYGVDKNNRPFTVTADSAVEEDPKAGIIVLDKPKADFATRDGHGVYVEAVRGFYHQKEQLLELEGQVALFHDEGYELHTEEAAIDLGAGTAEGTRAVTGNGPQGRIDGQGFRIVEKGRQILVTGRSMLQLQGAGGKKK